MGRLRWMRKINMKNILYILSNLKEDGGQTVVCTLLKELNNEQYKVKLLVMDLPVENKLTNLLEKNNIEFEFCSVGSAKGIYKLYRVYKMVKWINERVTAFSADIVHVHLEILYSWLWALKYKRKIIFTVHSAAQRYDTITSILFKLLKKKELISVTCVSKTTANQFEKTFKVSNVKVIYNPVDLEHFQRKSSREEKNEIIFVNVARFHPVKNHKLLIDAWDILIRELTNIKLILIGDGAERIQIQRMIEQKELIASVELLGEINDVAPILRNADVFVLSSLSEALPVSVIEAMAVGLPIISTNVGGLQELVTDNGILVESNNVLQLMEAMKELANSITERARMGELSEEYAEKFGVHKIVTQYEEIYSMID